MGDIYDDVIVCRFFVTLDFGLLYLKSEQKTMDTLKLTTNWGYLGSQTNRQYSSIVVGVSRKLFKFTLFIILFVDNLTSRRDLWCTGRSSINLIKKGVSPRTENLKMESCAAAQERRSIGLVCRIEEVEWKR